MPQPKIGKYQIIRELGRGATSVVHLALDPFSNRQVAIKVVQPDVLADQEHGRRFRKLFLTEASLAGKLAHPHIAAIYDAVADDEASYIVMEYVDGSTLEPFTRVDSLLPVGKVSRSSSSAARRWTTRIATRDSPRHQARQHPAGGRHHIKISDFGAALTVSSEATQVTAARPAYVAGAGRAVIDASDRHLLARRGDVSLLTGTCRSGHHNYSMVFQSSTSSAAAEHLPAGTASLDAVVKRAPKACRQTLCDLGGIRAGSGTHIQSPEDARAAAARYREIQYAAPAPVLSQLRRRGFVAGAAHRQLESGGGGHYRDSGG